MANIFKHEPTGQILRPGKTWKEPIISKKIEVDKNGNEVDGKSMIGILKLAIKQGEIFQLTIDGEDEETFMKQFEELVNKDV